MLCIKISDFIPLGQAPNQNARNWLGGEIRVLNLFRRPGKPGRPDSLSLWEGWFIFIQNLNLQSKKNTHRNRGIFYLWGQMEDTNLVRINKYFSEAGYCSRRKADKYIEQKRVTINGEVAEMGSKVSSEDEVRLDGKLIAGKENKPVYLAFNKPRGIVCTTDTLREKNNIIDYINYSERIFPIGRLDKDSQGLILLTNDGDIVNKILRARNNHEKEYLVTVKQPITKSFIQKMSSGVPVLDTITRKCFVEKIDNYRFRIILTQGLNRQIRRMCEYLDYRVTQLERYRIMNIHLDVPVGKWRHLTQRELDEINQLLADSSKTYEDAT